MREGAAAKQSRDAVPAAPKDTGPVKVASGATVKDLSAGFGVPAPQIIKIMMGVGEMVTITQTLSDDAIELIATESQKEVEIKHADEEEHPAHEQERVDGITNVVVAGNPDQPRREPDQRHL